MTEDENELERKRDALALAELIFDIYQEKKQADLDHLL